MELVNVFQDKFRTPPPWYEGNFGPLLLETLMAIGHVDLSFGGDSRNTPTNLTSFCASARTFPSRTKRELEWLLQEEGVRRFRTELVLREVERLRPVLELPSHVADAYRRIRNVRSIGGSNDAKRLSDEWVRDFFESSLPDQDASGLLFNSEVESLFENGDSLLGGTCRRIKNGVYYNSRLDCYLKTLRHDKSEEWFYREALHFATLANFDGIVSFVGINRRYGCLATNAGGVSLGRLTSPKDGEEKWDEQNAQTALLAFVRHYPFVLLQLVNVLESLYSQGFTSFDVKSDNFVIDARGGVPRMVDLEILGVVGKVTEVQPYKSERQLRKIVRTCPQTPPELLFGFAATLTTTYYGLGFLLSQIVVNFSHPVARPLKNNLTFLRWIRGATSSNPADRPSDTIELRRVICYCYDLPGCRNPSVDSTLLRTRMRIWREEHAAAFAARIK